MENVKESGALTFRIAAEDDIPALVSLVESAYRGDASRAGWTTEADLLEGQRTAVLAVLAEHPGGQPGQHLLAAGAQEVALGVGARGSGVTEHGRPPWAAVRRPA